jgi:hypothetical protein
MLRPVRLGRSADLPEREQARIQFEASRASVTPERYYADFLSGAQAEAARRAESNAAFDLARRVRGL